MSRVVFPAVVGPLAAQIDAEPMIATRVGAFEAVPPGLHRCSLLIAGDWQHTWLVVGADDVLRLPGSAKSTGPDLGESVPFPLERAAIWSGLTRHLARRVQETDTIGELVAPPVAINALLVSLDLYGGSDGVLAAIEQSFVEGFLTPDTGDAAAIARWRRLLAIVAGGGEAAIASSPELFTGVVGVLSAEIALLGSELLDDGFLYELDLLANELMGATDPQVEFAGIELEQLLFAGPTSLDHAPLERPTN